MKYLLCFFIIGIIISLSILLFDMIYGVVNQTAFLCSRCNGNGQDKYDPLFDCEECKSTGLLICETYSMNYPDAVWIKPLWFRWKINDKVEEK